MKRVYNKSMLKLFLPTAIVVVLFGACMTGSRSNTENEGDDTAYLQSLLDSPFETIVIPARKEPWITGPLFLAASHKSIEFEEGCTILAKKGLFLDPGDCLLEIRGASDITIKGNGAILAMNKTDYTRTPYKKGEWRHGIAIWESTDITIEGLTVRDCGGDGVYIGQFSSKTVCENIILRNLVIEDNHRQGVSVISVRDFLMESCTVRGTKGTPPMAGIDFEPNGGLYGFTGCVIRDCIFEGNAGAGIQIYAPRLTPEHPPFDLLVENTVSRKNLSAVAIYNIPRGVRGSVTFSNCTLSGFRWVRTSGSFTVRYINDRLSGPVRP